MRMTSAIWLNVAAIVVVVGIWTFAVAHAHRALARDERGPGLGVADSPAGVRSG